MVINTCLIQGQHAELGRAHLQTISYLLDLTTSSHDDEITYNFFLKNEHFQKCAFDKQDDVIKSIKCWHQEKLFYNNNSFYGSPF